MTKIYIIDLKKLNIKSKKDIKALYTSCLKSMLFKDYNILINDDSINKDEYNKPYINDDIYFNISHSNNLLVIAISKYNCGVDVEMIVHDEKHLKLCDKILSINEKKEYEKMTDKYDYLFRKWTEKEAYFKCKGKGIIYSQLKKEVNEKNKFVKKINYENDYYLSLYLDTEIIKENIQIIDYKLGE